MFTLLPTPQTQTSIAPICSALAYGSCDGIDQCTNEVGSDADEAGCTENYCNDGSSFPNAVKCDGIPDCLTGEDEDPSLCLK